MGCGGEGVWRCEELRVSQERRRNYQAGCLAFNPLTCQPQMLKLVQNIN